MFKYLTTTLILLFYVAIPKIASAQLVVCGTSSTPACTFEHIFVALNKVMNFLVISVATPLAAVLIAYGGAYIVVHASNPSKRAEGKNIIFTTLKGFVLVLAAFVLVKFIVTALTGDVGLLQGILGN
ncbi:MAG: hypothetical protein WDZ73_00940 [Candidatus Paceibacterota bacterium]